MNIFDAGSNPSPALQRRVRNSTGVGTVIVARTVESRTDVKPTVPGSVVSTTASVLSMTDSGVIAARLGGRVAATNSWLMPPYETPAIPTLWCSTHGCRAIVSMAS